MRRRDWMIVAMAFAIPMWVVCFLLPVSSIIATNCTPACDAVAGVTNCKNNGGSGECESTTSGCIHKQPAPSGHNLAVVTDDDPEQCICPFDTNKLWLQWERTRVYNCTLHCKSHVFSDKKDHEHKYRYDQICPTQGEVSGEVS
jgi:hypothetical protein